MDRIKLEKSLVGEISHYRNLPYFINTPQNPLQKLSVQVGKGNWRQIQKYTASLAKKQKVKLTPQNTYAFQKKNKIGLDCSALAYHLLDFLYQKKHHRSIKPYLIGTNGKTGPRRLSANLLTSPPNAIVTKNPQPGNLIRQKNGHHLLFIYKVSPDKIYYVHSSRQSRGVKLGNIKKNKSLLFYQLLATKRGE
ncbi:hypothetical protein KJ909_01520 [Patescibacteria group bacterium]|nr:hypothetical protein [Patescibacteria group bacterium]